MHDPGAKIEDARTPLFTSDRERRLWIWTVVVVAAIYATIGLANSLAFVMLDFGIVGVGFFMIGCLLVLVTVVTQGLRVRPSGAEVAVALGVAAVYLMVFVRMSVPTERSHLVEYGVVAVFIYEALMERANHGRRVPAPALLAFLATMVIGAIDECMQAIIPGRVFDPLDIVFDFIAAVMAVTASATLGWARRWAGRRRFRSNGGMS